MMVLIKRMHHLLTAKDGDLISRNCLLPPYGTSLKDHGNSSLSFHCTLDGTKMSPCAASLAWLYERERYIWIR
jgi:hypothetical protein